MCCAVQTMALVWLLVLTPGCFESQTGEAEGKDYAQISGRVSSQFVAGVKGATVYLFTLGQSKELRELRHKTRRLMRDRSADSATVTNAEAEFYNKAADLVPTLPCLVKTKTNAAGVYTFRGLTAERRYYVVNLDIDEDGVHFAAQITPILKPGQRAKVDLMDGGW